MNTADHVAALTRETEAFAARLASTAKRASGWWWDRSSGMADAVLAGPAADLLLRRQTRPVTGRLERSGATEVLARWEAANVF